MEPKRVVILISGRGSNMAALIDGARAAGYPARIVGVLSDKPDALGLEPSSGMPSPASTAAAAFSAGCLAGAPTPEGRLVTEKE